MKLEHQVCSLNLSKRLKELGVKQVSVFYWSGDEQLIYGDQEPVKSLKLPMLSAFTVAELGDMLPARIKDDEDIPFALECWKNNTSWQVSYWWEEDSRHLSGMKIETFN